MTMWLMDVCLNQLHSAWIRRMPLSGSNCHWSGFTSNQSTSIKISSREYEFHIWGGVTNLLVWFIINLSVSIHGPPKLGTHAGVQDDRAYLSLEKIIPLSERHSLS